MTIGEASRKYGLSPDTLRYYEKIGLIPHPKKVGKNRDYDASDCRWIEFAKCMRGAGLEISALQRYVSLYFQGDSTLSARRDLLIQQRDLLLVKKKAIEASLTRLDYKISHYETLCKNVKEKMGK